jgi:hypothetical protein
MQVMVVALLEVSLGHALDERANLLDVGVFHGKSMGQDVVRREWLFAP